MAKIAIISYAEDEYDRNDSIYIIRNRILNHEIQITGANKWIKMKS